jgi:hypothetical protein
MSKFAVVALLACLLLAGCGGPLGESTTTDAEPTANATRAIAAPASETGTNGTTGADPKQTTGEAGVAPTGTASDSTAGATEPGDTSAEQTAADETAAEFEEASASGGADADGASAATEASSENTEADSGTVGVAAAGTATRTVPPETTNGTATNQTTTEETYERNMPYEVRISNTGTAHRNITVRVAAENDSAAVFEVSSRFAPNETREFDFTVASPGEYEARVEVEGAVTTKRWDIGARDPERALSVHVSPDGRVYVGFLDI